MKKIPYIKIPITDMYAYLAPCTPQTKGEILQAILAFGMYQTWPNLALDPVAQQAYSIVKQLIEREVESYQKFCKEQKQKIKKYWNKKQNNDDTTVLPGRNNQLKQEQELKQETKPKQEQEEINTPIPPMPPSAQGESTCPGDFQKNSTHNPRLLAFANQVLACYEANVKTDIQKSIWLRKNRRHLRDILNFCGADITLALRTIRVCILHLKQAGLSGGYAAVCRHLPDYAAQAQQELEEEYGYTK